MTTSTAHGLSISKPWLPVISVAVACATLLLASQDSWYAEGSEMTEVKARGLKNEEDIAEVEARLEAYHIAIDAKLIAQNEATNKKLDSLEKNIQREFDQLHQATESSNRKFETLLREVLDSQ